MGQYSPKFPLEICAAIGALAGRMGLVGECDGLGAWGMSLIDETAGEFDSGYG